MAIEGLQKFNPDLDTVPIVIAIIIFLFLIQQLGTQQIGKFFGPIMLIWFSFIGGIGLPTIAIVLITSLFLPLKCLS
jgi:KUP system potassium uptake protein